MHGVVELHVVHAEARAQSRKDRIGDRATATAAVIVPPQHAGKLHKLPPKAHRQRTPRRTLLAQKLPLKHIVHDPPVNVELKLRLHQQGGKKTSLQRNHAVECAYINV
jgi:hypothetical protein